MRINQDILLVTWRPVAVVVAAVVTAVATLAAGPSWAAQAQPPEAAGAVQELTGPSKTSLDARNWRLDPAVFTEITPFTAPDIAIELPLDQQEEAPVPQANPTPVQAEPR